MLSDADQKFYTKLFILLFIIAFIARQVVSFVGVTFEIPYLDPFFKATWSMIGAVIKAFAKWIGAWHE